MHSGYGERGKLHLFSNPVEDTNIKKKLEYIFEGYDIDWGDSDDFYSINGDYVVYVGKVIQKNNQDSVYMAMPFEFGTMDSQTTMGSIKSLHTIVIENQGYHHGYQSPEDEIETKKAFTEMFYPSSDAWRSKAITDAREVFSTMISNYLEL